MEAAASYSTIESTTDVAKLLQVIKGVAFDANEKKYPTQQATKALQGLLMARQQDEEDLVDCYKRFMDMNEMVE